MADDARPLLEGPILEKPHAGRADYDELVTFHGIEPGEPFFMIRGKDAAGADTVRAWVMLASERGAPPALLEQALRQADKLEAWPVKKVADADHLTDAEQKQLVFCLQRRAWNAREDVLDIRVFYAEQRAWRSAEAKIAGVRVKLQAAIDVASQQLLVEMREILAEVQRAIIAGDREAGLRWLTRSNQLAAAKAELDALKGALDG